MATRASNRGNPGDESAPVALLRRHDRDRYLLTLFAPAARRGAIQAIYAFNYEIARVRETVSEPTLGRIRLEWWREGVAAAFGGGSPRRHEVLTPLTQAIQELRLTQDHFERLIAARERDLAPDPPPSLAALEAYAEESSAPLQLLVLEALGATNADANRAAREVGIAYALAGLMRAAAFMARSPRHAVSPVLIREPGSVASRAQHHLDRARAVRGSVSHAALPALLPAALAAADLSRLRLAGYDPAQLRSDPWRAWRLAIASWTGRY